MLITPRTIIDLVIEKKTKSISFRPYETATQKNLFVGTIISVTFGTVFGVASKFYTCKWIALAAVILLLISEILAIFYQISSIFPEFKKLKNIEKETSHPFTSEFNNDLDLINELASIGEEHHLQFAEENFRLIAKQLRERIAVLVGALDKVGIIPLAITGYISLQKILKDGLVVLDGTELLSVVIVLFYIFALRMTATAQWMERIAEIFCMARIIRSKK